MALRTIQEYRALGEAANLEDDWIQTIESEPEALDAFLAVAQGLAAGGEEERARSLLELYDSELRERGLAKLRLELLRRAGALAVRPAKLHKEVLSTLEKIWAGKDNLQKLIEHVGLHKSVDSPAKLWDQVNRLQSLLLYDVGEVVTMASQGVGRVVEVNLPLETLKIDFEKQKGVTVGFRAAAKMLTPLPAEHLLRRKLEDPESLSRLREQQPAELLRAVLESADKPLTGGEIRDMLAGVVSESQWSSWWSAARRHPQVVATTGGRQSYRWEQSTAGALSAIRKSFDRATPAEQLELFRKHAARDPELAAAMANRLAGAAGDERRDRPAFAFETWYALERAGRLPPALPWSVDDLVGPASDVRALLAGLEDRLLRERALVKIRQARPDWPAVYRDQMQREVDPRVLDLIAAGLADDDPEEYLRQLDGLISQPRKAPAAFVWLAEKAAEDEALRTRSPLRLLQQILAGLASEELAPYRTRVRALVESGGTLPRLFGSLSEDQAGPALDAIGRSSLDAFLKDPLRNAILLRFPALREEDNQALYATPESIEAKRREMRQLTEVEIPANRKAIEEARAMGDLRENFEYKSARERHEYLNSRLATLHRDLGRVRPIETINQDLTEVRIGTSVELRSPDGKSRRFTLLGPWESRPEQGVLSYESELGALLLGRKIDEPVAIGEERLKIVRIAPAFAAVTP